MLKVIKVPLYPLNNNINSLVLLVLLDGAGITLSINQLKCINKQEKD